MVDAVIRKYDAAYIGPVKFGLIFTDYVDNQGGKLLYKFCVGGIPIKCDST